MSDTTEQTITDMTLDDLNKAYEGSYYFIAGAGGDLDQWLDGYHDLLAEKEIGKPARWFKTTGAAVNMHAMTKKGQITESDCFPLDCTILMFPLDGLAMDRLPIFKIAMQDRWYDDVIQNMRGA